MDAALLHRIKSGSEIAGRQQLSMVGIDQARRDNGMQDLRLWQEQERVREFCLQEELESLYRASGLSGSADPQEGSSEFFASEPQVSFGYGAVAKTSTGADANDWAARRAMVSLRKSGYPAADAVLNPLAMVNQNGYSHSIRDY